MAARNFAQIVRYVLSGARSNGGTVQPTPEEDKEDIQKKFLKDPEVSVKNNKTNARPEI